MVKNKNAFEVKIDSEFEHFLSRQNAFQEPILKTNFTLKEKNGVFNGILAQNTGMVNTVFPCYLRVYVQSLP